MSRKGGFAYGPVPSRRLGASLGVDVVPMKHCTYDCVYCQLGPTTTLTCERRAFFTVGEIVADVEERLASGPAPDVVTVAGSGEPTLYAELGELIDRLKGLSRVPVALLTNGALFHRADVRRDAARADLVLPSLDAGGEEMFQRVNRPAPGLTLTQVAGGLEAFRREYGGPIWLEVMVLGGLTDAPREAAAIARLAARAAPDRIQLNTPVRPAFGAGAVAVAAERLERLRGAFSPAAEAVAEWRDAGPAAAGAALPDDGAILRLLCRRPCTVEQIASALGCRPNAAIKALAVLEKAGRAHRVVGRGRVFWRAVGDAGDGGGGA